MDERVTHAIERFNADSSKTQEAEAAIQTLTDCFGDNLVDVVRSELLEDEISESLLLGIYTRGTPEEQTQRIYEYLKTTRPYWDVIIKFPHETVTNEVGRKTEIYNFFVKVMLKADGTLHHTQATKTTYTENQLYSGYVHSHCPSLSTSRNDIQKWKSMCFGGGPINYTIEALKRTGYDQRLWIGFAAELRQWVRTESVDGGPYFRMEHISKKYSEVTNVLPNVPSYTTTRWLKPLVKSYIRAKRLKVGFVGNKYYLGTTFAEWLMDFSNYALAWGEKNGITIPTKDTLIINNKVCKQENGTSRSAYANLIGLTVLRFKGEDLRLEVLPEEKVEHQQLIDYSIGVYVIKNILNVINYNYGREETANTVTPVLWG